MSKYTPLWQFIANQNPPDGKLKLTFEEAARNAGLPKIDHSFLTFKKELLDYGWKVEKISMKENFVLFVKN